MTMDMDTIICMYANARLPHEDAPSTSQASDSQVKESPQLLNNSAIDLHIRIGLFLAGIPCHVLGA